MGLTARRRRRIISSEGESSSDDGGTQARMCTAAKSKPSHRHTSVAPRQSESSDSAEEEKLFEPRYLSSKASVRAFSRPNSLAVVSDGSQISGDDTRLKNGAQHGSSPDKIVSRASKVSLFFVSGGPPDDAEVPCSAEARTDSYLWRSLPDGKAVRNGEPQVDSTLGTSLGCGTSIAKGEHDPTFNERSGTTCVYDQRPSSDRLESWTAFPCSGTMAENHGLQDTLVAESGSWNAVHDTAPPNLSQCGISDFKQTDSVVKQTSNDQLVEDGSLGTLLSRTYAHPGMSTFSSVLEAPESSPHTFSFKAPRPVAHSATILSIEQPQPDGDDPLFLSPISSSRSASSTQSHPTPAFLSGGVVSPTRGSMEEPIQRQFLNPWVTPPRKGSMLSVNSDKRPLSERVISNTRFGALCDTPLTARDLQLRSGSVVLRNRTISKREELALLDSLIKLKDRPGTAPRGAFSRRTSVTVMGKTTDENNYATSKTASPLKPIELITPTLTEQRSKHPRNVPPFHSSCDVPRLPAAGLLERLKFRASGPASTNEGSLQGHEELGNENIFKRIYPQNVSGDFTSGEEDCFTAVHGDETPRTTADSDCIIWKPVTPRVCDSLKTPSKSQLTSPPKTISYTKRTDTGSATTTARPFRKERQHLAEKWFKMFNATVFNNQLPEDLSIVWNSRLTRTAGQTYFTSSKAPLYQDPSESQGLCTLSNKRTCAIHLSCPVLDSEHRLRSTLLHEMCHVAQFLLEKETRPPHGPGFQRWARIGTALYPDIPVTVTHNYAIFQPYRYECKLCGHVYGRQTKIRQLSQTRCGRGTCVGELRFLGHFKKNGCAVSQSTTDNHQPTTATPRLTPYHRFIKDHFSRVQALNPGLKPTQILPLLTAEWKAKKATGIEVANSNLSDGNKVALLATSLNRLSLS